MTDQALELFQHELRDIYDAEHRFAEALEKMVEQVTDDSLGNSLARHLTVTREQARRLERVFEAIDERARRDKCAGADGLIREYETYVKKERPEGTHLDLFAAEAGMKAEHYEIVAYKGLVELARLLGLAEAASILRQNLREEEQAAEELENASRKLSVLLVGSEDGIVRSAADTLKERAQESAITAVGMAERFRERTSDALDLAEARGRRVVGRARRKPTTRSRPAGRKTTARKAKDGARRTTRGKSSATSRTRSTSHKPAKRRPAAAKARKASRSTTSRRRTATATRRSKATSSRRGR